MRASTGVGLGGIGVGLIPFALQGLGVRLPPLAFVVLLILAAILMVVGFVGPPVKRLLTQSPSARLTMLGIVTSVKPKQIDGKRVEVQTVGIDIANALDAGGDAATARDVVPTLRVDDGSDLLGHWAADESGNYPSTVTFRPTKESHVLEIARKGQGDEHWFLLLRGGSKYFMDRPSKVELEVSLRGDNLPEPFRVRLLAENPGAQECLRLTRNGERLKAYLGTLGAAARTSHVAGG